MTHEDSSTLVASCWNALAERRLLMGRRGIALLSVALAATLMVDPAAGQWSDAQDNSAGYGTSSLFQSPTGSLDGNTPPVYYPEWQNYLDNLQRSGGYEAVTGNYPNSIPITSYYPSSSSGQTYSPPSSVQAGVYSSPGSGEQSAGYGQGAPQAQTYQAPGYQAYQASPYQSYQAPPAANQQAAGASQSPKSSKKRRVSSGQQPAQAAPQQAYYQQQSGYQQQPYQNPQAYQQQSGYQQQPYQNPQAYQQQPNQQQPYGQQPYPQQANEQQAYGQAQDPSASPYSSDPIVQDAQRKAYERAVARQRAAELAAQQQVAAQELQQTQQMYLTAQQKLQEQEQRQRALQEEYHKKAVGEAYEQLRTAQQKYYDLMGVSGEAGRGGQGGQEARVVSNAPGQSMQYPQAAQGPAQPMQYPQQAASGPAQPMQYPQAGPQSPVYGGGQGYPVPAGPAPGGMGQQAAGQYSLTPPSQATPIHVQGAPQQQSGGGLWSALREMFSPSTPVVSPSQRTGFGSKSRNPVDEF